MPKRGSKNFRQATLKPLRGSVLKAPITQTSSYGARPKNSQQTKFKLPKVNASTAPEAQTSPSGAEVKETVTEVKLPGLVKQKTATTKTKVPEKTLRLPPSIKPKAVAAEIKTPANVIKFLRDPRMIEIKKILDDFKITPGINSEALINDIINADTRPKLHKALENIKIHLSDSAKDRQIFNRIFLENQLRKLIPALTEIHPDNRQEIIKYLNDKWEKIKNSLALPYRISAVRTTEKIDSTIKTVDALQKSLEGSINLKNALVAIKYPKAEKARMIKRQDLPMQTAAPETAKKEAKQVEVITTPENVKNQIELLINTLIENKALTPKLRKASHDEIERAKEEFYKELAKLSLPVLELLELGHELTALSSRKPTLDGTKLLPQTLLCANKFTKNLDEILSTAKKRIEKEEKDEADRKANEAEKQAKERDEKERVEREAKEQSKREAEEKVRQAKEKEAREKIEGEAKKSFVSTLQNYLDKIADRKKHVRSTEDDKIKIGHARDRAIDEIMQLMGDKITGNSKATGIKSTLDVQLRSSPLKINYGEEAISAIKPSIDSFISIVNTISNNRKNAIKSAFNTNIYDAIIQQIVTEQKFSGNITQEDQVALQQLLDKQYSYLKGSLGIDDERSIARFIVKVMREKSLDDAISTAITAARTDDRDTTHAKSFVGDFYNSPIAQKIRPPKIKIADKTMISAISQYFIAHHPLIEKLERNLNSNFKKTVTESSLADLFFQHHKGMGSSLLTEAILNANASHDRITGEQALRLNTAWQEGPATIASEANLKIFEEAVAEYKKIMDTRKAQDQIENERHKRQLEAQALIERKKAEEEKRKQMLIAEQKAKDSQAYDAVKNHLDDTINTANQLLSRAEVLIRKADIINLTHPDTDRLINLLATEIKKQISRFDPEEADQCIKEVKELGEAISEKTQLLTTNLDQLSRMIDAKTHEAADIKTTEARAKADRERLAAAEQAKRDRFTYDAAIANLNITKAQSQPLLTNAEAIKSEAKKYAVTLPNLEIPAIDLALSNAMTTPIPKFAAENIKEVIQEIKAIDRKLGEEQRSLAANLDRLKNMIADKKQHDELSKKSAARRHDTAKVHFNETLKATQALLARADGLVKQADEIKLPHSETDRLVIAVKKADMITPGSSIEEIEMIDRLLTSNNPLLKKDLDDLDAMIKEINKAKKEEAQAKSDLTQKINAANTLCHKVEQIEKKLDAPSRAYYTAVLSQAKSLKELVDTEKSLPSGAISLNQIRRGTTANINLINQLSDSTSQLVISLDQAQSQARTAPEALRKLEIANNAAKHIFSRFKTLTASHPDAINETSRALEDLLKQADKIITTKKISLPSVVTELAGIIKEKSDALSLINLAYERLNPTVAAFDNAKKKSSDLLQTYLALKKDPFWGQLSHQDLSSTLEKLALTAKPASDLRNTISIRATEQQYDKSTKDISKQNAQHEKVIQPLTAELEKLKKLSEKPSDLSKLRDEEYAQLSEFKRAVSKAKELKDQAKDIMTIAQRLSKAPTIDTNPLIERLQSIESGLQEIDSLLKIEHSPVFVDPTKEAISKNIKNISNDTKMLATKIKHLNDILDDLSTKTMLPKAQSALTASKKTAIDLINEHKALMQTSPAYVALALAYDESNTETATQLLTPQTEGSTRGQIIDRIKTLSALTAKLDLAINTFQSELNKLKETKEIKPSVDTTSKEPLLKNHRDDLNQIKTRFFAHGFNSDDYAALTSIIASLNKLKTSLPDTEIYTDVTDLSQFANKLSNDMLNIQSIKSRVYEIGKKVLPAFTKHTEVFSFTGDPLTAAAEKLNLPTAVKDTVALSLTASPTEQKFWTENIDQTHARINTLEGQTAKSKLGIYVEHVDALSHNYQSDLLFIDDTLKVETIFKNALLNKLDKSINLSQAKIPEFCDALACYLQVNGKDPKNDNDIKAFLISPECSKLMTLSATDQATVASTLASHYKTRVSEPDYKDAISAISFATANSLIAICPTDEPISINDAFSPEIAKEVAKVLTLRGIAYEDETGYEIMKQKPTPDEVQALSKHVDDIAKTADQRNPLFKVMHTLLPTQLQLPADKSVLMPQVVAPTFFARKDLAKKLSAVQQEAEQLTRNIKK